LFKWLIPEAAWDPSPAQRAAALPLAESVSLVRTHQDGTTELRTIKNNGLRRYIIAASGEVALVESGDPIRCFFWSDCLGAAAMLLMFASVGVAFFVGDGAAIALIVAAIVAFFSHLILFARTFQRTVRPGPDRWDRIGGPED
jgi:hypothetical protein